MKHFGYKSDYCKARGFTLIEVLVSITISAFLFVLVSSAIVNIFRSDTRSKNSQTMEQTKNDIKSELTNAVRWADVLISQDGTLSADGVEYLLRDGRLVKDETPLSHRDIEVTNLRIRKHATSTEAYETESGFGLTGVYYNGSNFQSRGFERIDNLLNFDWGSGSPDPRINPDSFSVRWTGQIESVVEGTYLFRLESNDQARLWIDDELLFNYGSLGVVNKFLNAEKRYNILIEYKKIGGNGKLTFSWAIPGGSVQIVPSKYLYPNQISSSLEISMDLRHVRDSRITDNLMIIVTPRSGTIVGGITDSFSEPVDDPIPTNQPTPTPPIDLSAIEETSGWPECNGWLPGRSNYNPDYDKIACRERALQRARQTYARFDGKDFYGIGLPLPPSGSKNSPHGGSDRAWYEWGMKTPSGEHFLGQGTSCGIGPSYCLGSSVPTIIPGR